MGEDIIDPKTPSDLQVSHKFTYYFVLPGLLLFQRSARFARPPDKTAYYLNSQTVTYTLGIHSQSVVFFFFQVRRQRQQETQDRHKSQPIMPGQISTG